MAVATVTPVHDVPAGAVELGANELLTMIRSPGLAASIADWMAVLLGFSPFT